MKALPTPREMAIADQATIASGVPATVLMERAGSAVARATLEVVGGRYGKRVAVVCGTGNNGGDGFVAARILHREGCAVRCIVVGDLESVKGAAAHHLGLMRTRGVSVEALGTDGLKADAIVDAIFGTGFHGTAEGAADAAIRALDAETAPVVAADIPSGLDGLTGRAQGPAVHAAITVTMGARKLGLAIEDGPQHAGRIDVADIGIPQPTTMNYLLDTDDVIEFMPQRNPADHKRSGASVLILAGSDPVPGAPMLAARAAGRMGAGYVTLASTSKAIEAAAVRLPEVLKHICSPGDHLGPEALDELKGPLEYATVLAVGPGLGEGSDQRALVERILGEIDIPIVVDADGLNVLAGNTELLRRRSDEGRKTVITPHPGELAKLLASSVDDVQGDRLAAVREASSRFGCIVVLKGHGTLVADGAEQVVAVNPTGGPVLATAGTGDVLTGALAALFTRAEGSVFGRACAAVYLHGLAGDIVAAERGSVGALAWDVAESLPAAIATIGASA
ncbi:MAG: ADP-dependent NAD(P)H-hydrate dehydratase / NAD(P)H-hydrate epimerase [Actinomycetota bacterium]|nr:ADP-dependent NAD(P)H-hydrate dehydratase / NAD(P)H-hydrate epimerase [Actinomycetota bacterium]